MAVSADILARVKQLRAEIERHNYNYYVLDRPVISDGEYDVLFRELQEIELQHPQFIVQDSPTQRVGIAPVSDFAQVIHRAPMLSLNNAFSNDDVIAFDKRVRESLDIESVEYGAEPKFDGLAVSLTYDKGVLVTGATRDDGYTGE